MWDACNASVVKETYPYRHEGTLSMSQTLANFDHLESF